MLNIAGAVEFPWYFVLFVGILLLIAIVVFAQLFVLPTLILAVDYKRSRNNPGILSTNPLTLLIAGLNLIVGLLFLFQAKTNLNNSVEFHENGELYILLAAGLSSLFLLIRYLQKR